MSVQPPINGDIREAIHPSPFGIFDFEARSRVFLISRAMRSNASSQEIGVHSLSPERDTAAV